METKKHFLTELFSKLFSKLLIGLIPAGLLAGLLNEYWSAASSVGTAIYEWLLLLRLIPTWQLVLMWTALIVVTGLLIRLFWVRDRLEAHERLYTAGTFGTVHWRWQYRNKQITELRPYCADCDTELTVQSYGMFASDQYVKAHCHHCTTTAFDRSGTLRDIHAMTIKAIERTIRKGEWTVNHA